MESHDTPAQQHESPAKTFPHRAKIIGATVVLGLIAVAFWATGLGRQSAQPMEHADSPVTSSGRPPTFSGRSRDLQQTVIVPTLDSPCPPGKNIIWCSSFQLAWNELKDKVIGAPLQVMGAEEIASRLNIAKQSSSDLEPGSFYATGGWIKDGIIDKIKKDMAVKFPSHVLPDFNDYDSGIMAYSYLTANVAFTYPFRQAENGLTFSGAQGSKTQVEAFGLWQAFRSEYASIRDQAEVLCYDETRGRDPRSPMKEFAIDLCKYSQPYQVVLAAVEPNDSLAQTFQHLRTQVQEFKNRDNYESRSRLQGVDVVRAPEMFWEIGHHFRELVGRVVGNVNLPIVEAMQTIKFRLDRSGATVESEARFAVAAIPRILEFNRPFLVYMQKRGAEQPFFVMWVANAELLVRR